MPRTLVFICWTLAASQPLQLAAQNDTAQARRDSLPRRLLPPIVVTAGQVPVSARALGFAASVVDRRALGAEPTPYADQVLARLPGMWIDQGAGLLGPTTIHTRGGDEPFTQVLFDGTALNLTGGFMDMQGLPLTNVERVEVLRGPQSAVYGSSAVAGVVQFFTRKGHAGPLHLSGRLEGGGATTRGGNTRGEIDVLGGGTSFQYSAGAGVTYNRGIYDLPSDLLSRDASARLDAQPSRHWNVTATTRYMYLESHLPVRDAGVTRVPLDPNQRDTRTRLLSSLTANYAPGRAWRHQLTASVYRDDFFYEDMQDGIDPAAYPFFVFDFNFDLRSVLWRQSLEWVAIHPGASGRPTVSFGARGEREVLSVDQGGDFGPDTSAYRRRNGALFAELDGTLAQRLHYVVGARTEQLQGLGTHLMPRAGLAYDLVPTQLTVRAAAGRAFKAPNLQQQYLDNPFTEPNPDLAPETSVSWEIGLTGYDASGRWHAAGTFFHQRYINLIRTVPADTGTKQVNRNLGESRAVGVEVEVEAWVANRVRTGANLTWVDATIVDNTGLAADLFPVGERLPATPQLLGTAAVEARLTDRVTAVVRGTYVGEQVVFTERFRGSRVTVSPYFLLGATVHLRLSDDVRLYVRGENLLNTHYATAYDRPGLPPTAAVGLTLGS